MADIDTETAFVVWFCAGQGGPWEMVGLVADLAAAWRRITADGRRGEWLTLPEGVEP